MSERHEDGPPSEFVELDELPTRKTDRAPPPDEEAPLTPRQQPKRRIPLIEWPAEMPEWYRQVKEAEEERDALARADMIAQVAEVLGDHLRPLTERVERVERRQDEHEHHTDERLSQLEQAQLRDGNAIAAILARLDRAGL